MFPDYARRSVAVACGWPLHDTVTAPEASTLTWQPLTPLLTRLRAKHGPEAVVPDLAGRSYLRLSLAHVPQIAEAVAAAFRANPSLSELAPVDWAPLDQARRRMPEWERVAPFAPALTVPTTKAKFERCFVWVGPTVLKAAAQASLEAALMAAGHGDIPASEMVQAEHAFLLFADRFPFLKHGVWQHHLVSGQSSIMSVTALGIVRDGIRPVRYIHVPPAVYQTKDPERFKAWYIPRYTPKASRRRARENLRLRHARIVAGDTDQE